MQKPFVKYVEEEMGTQFYTGRIVEEYAELEEAIPNSMRGTLKELLDAAYLQGQLDGIEYAMWAQKKIE